MKFLSRLKNPDIRNVVLLSALFLVMLLILFTANRNAERRAREEPYGTPGAEVTLPVPPGER